MTFSYHEGIETQGISEVDRDLRFSAGSVGSARDGFPFINSKLKMPAQQKTIERPRLIGLLSRSIEQFPATLISGRAGTGKTALAAAFSQTVGNYGWYSVESSDREWPVFRRYFARFIQANVSPNQQQSDCDPEPRCIQETDVARFLVNAFAVSYAQPTAVPRLLVMDDIHHIFDAHWFDEFFQLLLFSLPSNMHLLMLCRSKPPSPLWRLRSKQMLNVLDEKVIAFTPTETEELFKNKEYPSDVARIAHAACYGRVSKLLQYLEMKGQ